MAAKKFAVSVPPDVMAQVDEAAAERGMTRSAYLVDVLRKIASIRSDLAVTRKVNEMFSDPELQRDQVSTARALSRRMPKQPW